MSASSTCCQCGSEIEVTSVPGTNGENAFTTVIAPGFTVPAIGATVAVGGIPAANTNWISVGQDVYIAGAGVFRVTVVTSTTNFNGTYRGDSGTDNAGSAIATGATISPSGSFPTTSGITALTDNSTGTASNTIAAGVGVQVLEFPHTFIGGTSAVEPVTNYTVGFAFKILSWAFVTEVALVGASGSRVANMEIGTTDVGTVPSTITIPIANTAVGTVTAGTAVSGANTGTNASTFSIEIASGGTQFTAGSGTFLVTVQNMDTSNAVASIAAKTNTILTTFNP